MKTIQIPSDSALIKYYRFLTCRNEHTTQYYLRNETSCGLNATLISLTVLALVALFVIFVVTKYVFAGLFLNLYVVFWICMWPWDTLSFYGGSFLDGLAACEMLLLMALSGGTVVMFFGLYLIPNAWAALKAKVRSWVENSSLESSVEPARELYRSWKDKYCSKIELTD